MRITNNMLINNMMGYINGNLSRMNKYQSQLATGKKISVPSDDPIVAAKSLKLRTDVAEVEQFKRNSNDANSWMSVTENSMGMIVDVLQRARELAVQAANGTMTQDDRGKVEKEVEQLKHQIIHISNSTYAGRYVFSGHSTDSPLMNADGTYKISVASEETAIIKSGLIDLTKSPIDNTSSNLSFQICLDGTNYRNISLPAKNYNGTLNNNIEDMVNDIQSAVSSYPELENIKVKNDGGRLEFSLKNTIDENGNRMKMYIKKGTPEDLLDGIKVKTDPVTNIVVSKSEDINYQIGISDNLNVNILGTQLFGTGTKNDMGDFMVAINRFIDSLTRPDKNSFISGNNLPASASEPLVLTNNNQFNIKVDGMGSYTTIIIPDPGDYTYDGTAGKTLNDLVSGIQTAIDGDPSLAAANVKVKNEDGKIVFSADNKKITLMEGPASNDALSALKIYTNTDGTITSQSGEEGISTAISDLENLRDRVMSIRSDIGARTNRIELTLNRLESDTVNFTQLMSENEDVDMAETIMNLKNEENVYKASLEGGARIIQPSLMDFLR